MPEMTKEDANNLDEVVQELGIEDDFQTPAEAVRQLKACHNNQAETIKAFHTKIEHLEMALIQAERSRDGWIDINAAAGLALREANNRIGELTMAISNLLSRTSQRNGRTAP